MTFMYVDLFVDQRRLIEHAKFPFGEHISAHAAVRTLRLFVPSLAGLESIACAVLSEEMMIIRLPAEVLTDEVVKALTVCGVEIRNGQMTLCVGDVFSIYPVHVSFDKGGGRGDKPRDRLSKTRASKGDLFIPGAGRNKLIDGADALKRFMDLLGVSPAGRPDVEHLPVIFGREFFGESDPRSKKNLVNRFRISGTFKIIDDQKFARGFIHGVGGRRSEGHGLLWLKNEPDTTAYSSHERLHTARDGSEVEGATLTWNHDDDVDNDADRDAATEDAGDGHKNKKKMDGGHE